MRPWWWLDEGDRAALGVGAGVRRTSLGFVFGAPPRIEIVPRTAEAPVRLGPIAIRLWGAGDPRAARALLLAVVARLGPRLEDGFDPDAVPFAPDAVAPASRAPSAPTTVIDVPSACDRACVFCHVSRRPLEARAPRGSDDDVERAIASASGEILFTGDDALSHPRLVEWVARAPHGASVIGPPRARWTAALLPRLARAGLRRWTTALLGASAEAHDRIAGRAGAFDALLEAVAAARDVDLAVELVTPLVTPLLPGLPEVVRRGEALGRHTLLAYAPDSMVGTAFDALVPSFSALATALEAVADGAASLDALPLCVLPGSRRSDAAVVLDRTDAELAAVHPPLCDPCALRARCPGVASTVLSAVGTVGLVPLRLPAGRAGRP